MCVRRGIMFSKGVNVLLSVCKMDFYSNKASYDHSPNGYNCFNYMLYSLLDIHIPFALYMFMISCEFFSVILRIRGSVYEKQNKVPATCDSVHCSLLLFDLCTANL